MPARSRFPVTVATCAPALARAAGAVVVFLAGLGALLAEPTELPLEADVLTDRIALDLRGGRVDVVFDPDLTPTLSVHDMLRPDSSEGLVLVDQTEDGLTIGQPHGVEEVAPRLYAKLVLRPGTRLSITGEDLAISITASDVADLPDPLAEAIAAAQQAAANAAPQSAPPNGVVGDDDTAAPLVEPDVRIAVSRSTASVDGIPVSLDGHDSRFVVERASGLLVGRLRGGDLRIERCAGRVELDTSDADVVLRRFGGSGEFAVERGSILVDSGAGSLAGRAREGRLVVERWFGGLIVDGGRSRFEIRGAGTPKSDIRINGHFDDIVLEELAGRVSLSMEGGQLDARSLSGTMGLDAQSQATVAITGSRGNCDLRLSDGARAKVKGIEQRLSTTISDARLEVEKSRDLDLRATSATVVAHGVTGRTTIRALDSELDLDLASATSNPSLDLSGATQTRLALPAPCVVRLNGDPKETADRMTLNGCDLDGPSARPRYGARQQIIVAETKLGDTATLNVRSGS